MSYILAALKKIDDAILRERQTSDQKLEMKALVYRRVKGAWTMNRFLPLLAAFLLLGAGWGAIETGIYFSEKAGAQAPVIARTSQTAPSTGSLEVEENPETEGLESASTRPSSTFLPYRGRGGGNQKRTGKRDTFSTSTGLLIRRQQQEGGIKENRLPVGNDILSNSSNHLLSIKSLERPSERSSAATLESPSNGLSKKAKPKIFLQGIIWDDDPALRHVLINGRYLTEGEGINGVSIVLIGKDSVLLQYGKKKWIAGL